MSTTKVRIVFDTAEPTETEAEIFTADFPPNLESLSWSQFFDTPTVGQITIEHIFEDAATAQDYASYVQSKIPSSTVWVV